MLRLAVRVRREDAELVLAALLELAPTGVEEVDLGEAVEYAVYGAAGELPALPDVQAVAGKALVEVSTSEVADDWAERWREFHRPLVLEGALTVRPPWEPLGNTPVDVVIDPGQAFGTGAHATTRLCLELLLERAEGAGEGLQGAGQPPGSKGAGDPRRPLGSLLDLGCGSGVLAIVAARLGYAPVLAVDYDSASLEATQTNAVVNEVVLEVRRLDLRADALPAAGTVLANLLSPLLIACAAQIAGAATERVIASGVLVAEADDVARAFTARGLTVAACRRRGEWAAMVLERPRG